MTRIAIALFLCGFPLAALAGPTCGLYQYQATITRVIDGDTVRANIDLGFHTWRHDEVLRLWGVNTPEMKGPEAKAGKRAKDALTGRILGKTLAICTLKDEQEKYGRYLVKLYVGDELVNDWLIKTGLGEPYMRD
jgi:micrococcal nuclease